MTTQVKFAFFAGICLVLTCCILKDKSPESSDHLSQSAAMKKNFDFQGHRGCRGLLPENSIEGFIRALDIGVTTLEMDVVITADKEVLLSHDPYFSHLICTGPNGFKIAESNEKDHAIYSMTYNETKAYDCGSKKHPSFPEQSNFPLHKPLLRDVIKESEQHSKESGRAMPYYNIETKCTPDGDGTLHPGPEEFANLLAKVIAEMGIEERAIVQSFDIRTLQYLQRAYPNLKLALLIENMASPQNNIEKLGFTPEIYSPYYKLVNKKLVDYCARERMKLIPWTVNEPSDMEDLINMGVDGIISDYPDRFSTFIPNQN